MKTLWIVYIFLISVIPALSDTTIVVIDRMSGNVLGGVEIRQLDYSGDIKNPRNVYITNEAGVATISSCSPGEKFIPILNNYMIENLYCGQDIDDATLYLKVSSVTTVNHVVSNLVKNANVLESNGDYGSAALAYNEVYYLGSNNYMVGDDGVTSLSGLEVVKELGATVDQNNIFEFAREKVYSNVAKHLQVDENTVLQQLDPQSSKRMTAEFKGVILSFQEQKELKKTGRIDLNTLNAISNYKSFVLQTKDLQF